MARLVMKFGGTSVADLERIRRVARLVAAEVDAGHEVAVVVSAMAGRTNELGGMVPGRPRMPARRDDEYDVVVASGEQVSAGLLAIDAAQPRRQRPLLAGLAGADHHRRRARQGAHRRGVAAELVAALAAGEIPVMAGFQGVAPGEAASPRSAAAARDLSAVAIAAALRADRCDIYTDVDGVYTTDPRIEERARRLGQISYEEMLEMASLGAKVLQSRSVELAMAQRVPLRVLSSFVEPGAPDNQGTIVCDEEEIVEKRIVSGVAYSRDEAKISLFGLPDHPGVASDIFGRLADANVNVDMIVQSHSRQPARPTWSSPSASATRRARSPSCWRPRTRSGSRTPCWTTTSPRCR